MALFKDKNVHVYSVIVHTKKMRKWLISLLAIWK